MVAAPSEMPPAISELGVSARLPCDVGGCDASEGACLERARYSLHRAWSDAEPLGYLAHAGPSRLLQGLLDGFFDLRGYRGPTEVFPFAPGPPYARPDAFY